MHTADALSHLWLKKISHRQRVGAEAQIRPYFGSIRTSGVAACRNGVQLLLEL